MTREELSGLAIRKPDETIYAKVKENWDTVAKPLDGLGEFETHFCRIGAILRDETVDIGKKAVLVFCADNGIVEEHVSQSGQEVTSLVARSMGKGESSVCRMASFVGASVIPVDIGIAGEESFDGVLPYKVAAGTKNFRKEPAMAEDETLAAVEAGILLVGTAKKQGVRLLATGEMGIGNTTTASAMAAALLAVPPETVTGVGAGLDGAGVRHKIAVIEEALKKYHLSGADAFTVLRTVGGLDIAGMAGVFLGGAVYGIPVVVDGLISAVAALTAERLVPGVRDCMLASHRGKEPASDLLLKELDLVPVLDAGLALGEGTGAVLLFPLLDTVRSVYGNRTTFKDIHMEPYGRFKQ